MAMPDSSAASGRPLVSMLVACYEQEHVVEHAVRSALAQTYSPLEIIISDDGSSDSTFAQIRRIMDAYTGPHRVEIRQNTRNEGISAHFSRLAKLAQGELLFVAAGDDISEPQRCDRVVAHWLAKNRQVDLIATDLFDVDDQNIVHGVITHTALDHYALDQWCLARPWLVGASHVWTKTLFERFGPMQQGALAEDQIMLLRAILSGGASTLHEPLVQWRRGGLSSKRRHSSLKGLIEHMRRGNQAGLATLEQHVMDAHSAGRAKPVLAALADQFARVRYTDAMLRNDSKNRSLRITWNARGVPLGYRLRLLGYTQLPWLYDFFIRMKGRIHLRHGSDAAGRPAK